MPEPDSDTPHTTSLMQHVIDGIPPDRFQITNMGDILEQAAQVFASIYPLVELVAPRTFGYVRRLFWINLTYLQQYWRRRQTHRSGANRFYQGIPWHWSAVQNRCWRSRKSLSNWCRSCQRICRYFSSSCRTNYRWGRPQGSNRLPGSQHTNSPWKCEQYAREAQERAVEVGGGASQVSSSRALSDA